MMNDSGSLFIDWKKVFQATIHSIMILDPAFQILAANDATIRLTGISSNDILGRKCYEVFHHDHKSPEKCPLKHILNNGGFDTVEEKMEALDGFFMVSCIPVFDKDGRLDKIIHMATDLSDLKRTELQLRDEVKLNAKMADLAQKVLQADSIQEIADSTLETDHDLLINERIASIFALGITRLFAQEALRQSEDKFSRLFRLSPALITLTTLEDGRYIDLNEAFTRLTGHTREIIGYTSLELGLWVNPADRQNLVSHLKKHGYVRDLEIQIRTKSGKILDLDISAEILDVAGVKSILIASHDITKRKNLEKTIKESELRYRLLAENLTDSLWTMDLNFNFTYVSPAILIMTKSDYWFDP